MGRWRKTSEVKGKGEKLEMGGIYHKPTRLRRSALSWLM